MDARKRRTIQSIRRRAEAMHELAGSLVSDALKKPGDQWDEALLEALGAKIMAEQLEDEAAALGGQNEAA